jgi:iron complex transport system ATP-binding protein
MMDSDLTAEGISYQQSLTFSLQDISIHFPKQKVTSIIGPNGSGKSTFLKVLTNLLSQDKGIVTIGGTEVSKMNAKALARKMTMLSQVQNDDLDLNVRELISHGRLPYRKWYEKLTNDDAEIIDWAISVTNLNDLQYQSINQLSGGERQRAWIAMAIVQSPDILLLDEPTTYLDISHQLEVMELVRYLNKKLNMTIIMVLHDINQAAKYSDHLIVMQDGRVVQSGNPKQVFNKALFRDVFSIHVKISEEGGYLSFTPTGLVK